MDQALTLNGRRDHASPNDARLSDARRGAAHAGQPRAAGDSGGVPRFFVDGLALRGPLWQSAVCWLVLVLGGLLTAKVVWVKLFKDVVLPRNFAVVDAGELYRSGRMSSLTAEKTLRAHGIRTVVSLVPDFDNPEGARPMIDAIRAVGAERVIVPMNGNGVSSVAKYADAVEAIARSKRAGKPVLVHCVTGSQRTGGVVSVYEVLVAGSSVEHARAELLRQGHDPGENPRLIPFLNENLKAIGEELVRRGVIDRVPDHLPAF